MCDIDRELVLRGAAHFATYAAGREPPRLDEFTARLIERALRAKVPAASIPPPITEKPNKLPRRQAEVVEFLRRRPSGATADDISKSLHIRNGNVHYFLGQAVAKGFASLGATGKYYAAARPPLLVPKALREQHPVSKAESQERIDRILTLLRADPAKRFRPNEIAAACNLPSPSDSGSVHGLLGRMKDRGLVAMNGRGLYTLGKKGAAA